MDDIQAGEFLKKIYDKIDWTNFNLTLVKRKWEKNADFLAKKLLGKIFYLGKLSIYCQYKTPDRTFGRGSCSFFQILKSSRIGNICLYFVRWKDNKLALIVDPWYSPAPDLGSGSSGPSQRANQPSPPWCESHSQYYSYLDIMISLTAAHFPTGLSEIFMKSRGLFQIVIKWVAHSVAFAGSLWHKSRRSLPILMA